MKDKKWWFIHEGGKVNITFNLPFSIRAGKFYYDCYHYYIELGFIGFYWSENLNTNKKPNNC